MSDDKHKLLNELVKELINQKDKKPINAYTNGDETNHVNFACALYEGLFKASCDECHTEKLNDDNHCDFCNRTLCDNCLPDVMSFRKCDTCGARWCYTDTKKADYYCEQNKRTDDTCSDCGN